MGDSEQVWRPLEDVRDGGKKEEQNGKGKSCVEGEKEYDRLENVSLHLHQTEN